MKKIWTMTLLLLFTTVIPAQEMLIASAANFQYALKDITAAFKKDSGIDIQTITGSSGKLTAQIRNGAPIDIFLSADMKYPKTLYKDGFASRPPVIYARGNLVLWSFPEIKKVSSIQSLSESSVRKIAVANPGTAPYGKAAVSALQQLGIYDTLKPKLVFGRNVAQVNQYIISGVVDAGITAKSAALLPEFQTTGHWIEIDSSLYVPIMQGALLLNHGQAHNPSACQKFLTFLSGDRARAILKKYGYRLP